MGVLPAVELEFETCLECGRTACSSGIALKVEGALDDQQGSPVIAELLALRNSRRRGDDQRYEDIMDRLERLAIHGKLEPTREWRPLEGSLWEVKTAEDRLPAFVRSANAGHVKSVRLTHLFQKRFGKTPEGRTPRKHIDRGLWMMRKDQEHDDRSA